ncbi:hypothetical protein OAI90_02125 [Crocinitomicaceae bacterium]|nr:hypothetical protein [Crocinitomicaceae bacterium]
MSLRHFIPGVLWVLVMGLLFLAPQSNPPHTYFGTIPSRSILHGIMFLGFVHIWIGALKKQLKHASIRNKAVKLVFGSALILTLITELIVFLVGINSMFSLWNLLFDIVGAALGILTFKLLYQQCY